MRKRRKMRKMRMTKTQRRKLWTELLAEEGHNWEGGRCKKCWRLAAQLYAHGSSVFESHQEAYEAALELANREAERKAREENEREI